MSMVMTVMKLAVICWIHWWASPSDMLIYPSIFTFPLLPLHCQSTSMHPCTRTCFIRLISLIWWTHDLQFTCFTSILSIPNVHPPMVQPIMSPHTAQPGTFYSFAFLSCWPFVFNLHVFTFHSRRAPTNCLYEFPPEFRFSTYTSHCITFASHHFALHCTTSQSHCLYPAPHLETIPYPQIAPSEPHRIYT